MKKPQKKRAQMKETTVGPPMSIRFDEDERMALARAALEDDRPAAVTVRRVVREWLKARGLLK
jgi:hypothetical protein